MKYEFIQLEDDTVKLKYKDKEFTFKRNVKLISEMQEIIMKSRIKMTQDLAKDGISIKDLVIEKKENGKTYYDNSNKLELEKAYQEKMTMDYFNNKCEELFNMDLASLMLDIGLTTEDEGSKFSNDFIAYLSGNIPSK